MQRETSRDVLVWYVRVPFQDRLKRMSQGIPYCKFIMILLFIIHIFCRPLGHFAVSFQARTQGGFDGCARTPPPFLEHQFLTYSFGIVYRFAVKKNSLNSFKKNKDFNRHARLP